MVKLFDLHFDSEHYYIKRSTIVEKIIFDNRTFYSKFEKISSTLTPLVVQQHLNKQYTIAVPLIKNNLTDYLVLDYKGEESIRFASLVKHIFKLLHIEKYHIYQGKSKQRLQVFVKVNALPLEEAHTQIQNISIHLNKKISKQWKCLPLLELPSSYNIVTLPYKIL